MTPYMRLFASDRVKRTLRLVEDAHFIQAVFPGLGIVRNDSFRQIGIQRTLHSFRVAFIPALQIVPPAT